MSKQSNQWTGKTGGGKFGQKSLFFMLRRVNVFFLYPILFAVVPFYMLFSKKGYKAIMHYFKQCYNLPTWKAFWQTFQNHLIFGQIVLDKFAVLSGNKTRYTINITGKPYYDELATKNSGLIIASSHIGNFEMGSIIFQNDKRQKYALVYEGESAELQKNRIKTLKESNINLISVKEDMSHLFTLKQALENGGIVIIPCDRLYGSSKKITCKFLKRNADFPLAPFHLAARMNVPLISLFVMKDNYKTYHAYIIPIASNHSDHTPIQKAESLARHFAAACEQTIKKYPQQWFNFYEFWGG
ncbi:MAG: lysophospholipid acyltransferase family protein [Lentimicrobiaceae bacterium]|nr:lysophospholipid acyltransferase family protein [Lentimicrobiaceae bacterium]